MPTQNPQWRKFPRLAKEHSTERNAERSTPVRVRPGRRVDRIDGNGIVYSQGGRAPYKISGLAGGGPDFSEKVRGAWVFGPNCTGNLRELRNARVSFQTIVDSKGRSKTRVWRE